MTAPPGAGPLWGRRRAGGREPGQQDGAVGVGEPINAAYVLRAKDDGRGGWPSSLMAAVLEATPGAGLAGHGVRAAGAAARTRKDVKCKVRAGQAKLYIGRVIGREARTPPRPEPARSKSQRPARQRRRPHKYSAAVACELPSWAELVRHGGVLIKPARGVGTGARGATRLGRHAPRVNGPEASRSGRRGVRAARAGAGPLSGPGAPGAGRGEARGDQAHPGLRMR